ncbi:unnamed protein product, partial [Iphiclides podalirius]
MPLRAMVGKNRYVVQGYSTVRSAAVVVAAAATECGNAAADRPSRSVTRPANRPPRAAQRDASNQSDIPLTRSVPTDDNLSCVLPTHPKCL